MGDNRHDERAQQRTMADVSTKGAPATSGTTRTFRGISLDDAVDQARRELGTDVQVLSANRLRRGGINGFFATEIGVEITVLADGNTPETPRLDSAPTTAASSRISDVVAKPAPRGVDDLVTSRVDRFEARSAVPDGASTRSGDLIDVVTDRISQREAAAGAEVLAVAQAEREARQRAREFAEREDELRMLMDTVAERERVAAVSASLDAERRRSAQLEVERDRAVEDVMNERVQAAAELARIQAQREQAERDADSLRQRLGQAERERDAAALQTELMRDALSRRHSDTATTSVAAPREPEPAVRSSGLEVLHALGVPERIVTDVARGTALRDAIPVGPVAGELDENAGLVVLVGARGNVVSRMREIAQRCSVRPGDMAFATLRELVSRDDVGAKVLTDHDAVETWIAGRLDPRRTSVLAIEWNASPGWTTGVRRLGRAAQGATWRVVLPASYPLEEADALLRALATYRPGIDVIGAGQHRSQVGQMLAFAEQIATVDGRAHSGDVWATMLWEHACRL